MLFHYNNFHSDVFLAILFCFSLDFAIRSDVLVTLNSSLGITLVLSRITVRLEEK